MNADKLKERILNDLHISEVQYVNYAFEAGHAYLEARRESFYKGFHGRHGFVDCFIRRLAVSRLWWTWWMQGWKDVDCRFMLVTPRSLSLYLLMHVEASERRVPSIDMVERIIETANELEAITTTVPPERISAKTEIPLNELA